MQAYEALLWLAGGATAIGVIYKAICAIYIRIKRAIAFVNGISTNVQTLVDHDRDQYLDILRLTIVSSDMPMSERLLAGRRYISKGGNGDVKKLYEELCAKCDEGL